MRRSRRVRFASSDRTNRSAGLREELSRRSGLTRVTCAGAELGERLRLVRREVGQHFAVELDLRQLDPVHEVRVGQTLLARCRVDAGDPQTTEVALADTPVPVCVPQRPLDLFFRATI